MSCLKTIPGEPGCVSPRRRRRQLRVFRFSPGAYAPRLAKRPVFLNSVRSWLVNKAVAQIANAVGDVFHAPFLIADLAFDAERAAVTDLL